MFTYNYIEQYIQQHQAIWSALTLSSFPAINVDKFNDTVTPDT